MKMKICAAITLVYMLFLSTSPGASALDFSGQSRTYLQSRETAGSGNLLPLYEYLDFRTENFGGRNLIFRFGGWYRFDLQDASFGETKQTGDLQYAYLGYRDRKSNAFLDLGRVLAVQGAAFERVDGVSAGTDLKGGFGVAAFGGIPVETDRDSRSGDSVYGGRISQGRDGLYRIGLSYVLEKNDSLDFREEEGLDLWFRPFDSAELLGTVVYNAITSAAAQTSLYLTLGPFKNLALRTQYMGVSYKDYFTATTLDAFQLVSSLSGTATGQIDPDENLAMIGEEASLSLGKTNISADYRKYDYDIRGSADYYGAKVSYSGAHGGGLAYHRMEGETKELQYSEYRLYSSGKIGKIDVTADALMVKYDREISGVKNAYSVALAGGYVLSPGTMVGADVEYAKNPYYDRDVRGFLKVVHDFDFAPRAKGRRH